MPSDTPQTTKRTCDWHDDGEGTWRTSCDNAFTLNDGTPYQNDMRFCCYCGGALAEWRILKGERESV